MGFILYVCVCGGVLLQKTSRNTMQPGQTEIRKLQQQYMVLIFKTKQLHAGRLMVIDDCGVWLVSCPHSDFRRSELFCNQFCWLLPLNLPPRQPSHLTRNILKEATFSTNLLFAPITSSKYSMRYHFGKRKRPLKKKPTLKS